MLECVWPVARWQSGVEEKRSCNAKESPESVLCFGVIVWRVGHGKGSRGPFMKYDFEIVFVCVFASVVGMVVFHNSVFCSVSTEFQVLLSLFTALTCTRTLLRFLMGYPGLRRPTNFLPVRQLP